MIEYIVTENKRSGKQSAFVFKEEKDKPLIIHKVDPDLLRELIDRGRKMEVKR